jgi:hypothetical protein
MKVIIEEFSGRLTFKKSAYLLLLHSFLFYLNLIFINDLKLAF